MVTTFNTAGGAGAGAPAKSGGSNTLLWVVVGLGAAYLLYRYVIKPQMDKNKQKEAGATKE